MSGSRWKSMRQWLESMWKWLEEHIRPVGAAATAIALLGSEVWVAFLLCHSERQRGLSLAIIAAGVALGWLLGTLASPYDESESTEFKALGAAVSAFISGYLLAKIDPLVVALLEPGAALQPLHAFRLLSFVTSTVVASLVTYVFRRYLDEQSSETPPSPDVASGT